MGRWRPPPERSSPYITALGAARLDAELKRLWNVDRRETVKALAEAAAEGDRSENAEYIYRKKQLGEIDRRIRYLSKRLDVVEVIDRVPKDQSRVRFGAFVSLEQDDGTTTKFRIVGADETDAELGFISVDSPVARALLGKTVGEIISVALPEGTVEYELSAIAFDLDQSAGSSS